MPSPGSSPPDGENLVDAGDDLTPFHLRPGNTVAEALERLRQNGLGIGVVVGEDDIVVGAVTDGDIRRAALEGATVASPIADVMPARPVLASSVMPDEEIVDLLRAHRLRAVPVVESGQLVGMRFLNGFPQGRSPRAAVIMAGGRGMRLRPVTDKVPKPLLKLGSKSIVERLILGFAEAGVEEVFLAINYMADVFEERLGSGDHLGVTLRYIREEHAMGTAGALSLLPQGIEGPLLVANGDIVTSVDFSRLFEYHWRHRGAVSVAGVEYRSLIPYGVLRNAGHHLLSIDEKPERRDFCSAGIYVLEPEVLQLLAPKEAMGMPELIADVLAEGLPVHVFPILEGWYDIGETAQFERVLVQFATGVED